MFFVTGRSARFHINGDFYALRKNITGANARIEFSLYIYILENMFLPTIMFTAYSNA